VELAKITQEKNDLEKRIPDLINQAVDRIKSELKKEGWKTNQ